MSKKLESLCPSNAADCSLASFIGFAATKDFRAARRAMIPTPGDTFITRREGELMFCQVDWVDEEWIGYGRFLADSGEPLGFFKIAQNDWKQSAMKALRIGCEFRPVNVKEHATPTENQNQL
jgi:hypothetical protein